MIIENGDMITTISSSDTQKPKMDPEIKAKWLAKLRSGEYKQTQKAMRDQYGFCCLGVLADIIDPEKWDETKHDFKTWNDGLVDLGKEESTKIGLADSEMDILMHLNDTDEKTFLQISDYIEENL